MASPSRRSQSAALQVGAVNGTLLASSRSISRTTNEDPLQPLRAMADRVGKEVEKFAERVDHWHAHSGEDAKTRYQATLRMVGKFKDIADSTVKELKKQSDAENKRELQKSLSRRIQHMAGEERSPTDADPSKSFQSVMPSVESSSIPQSTRVQELRQWEAEAATWDLLQVVIGQYHPEPGTDVTAERISRLQKVGGANRYCPNSEIWDRFLLEDDQAKEKELILRWLERTAKSTESDIEEFVQQLETESGMDTRTWTSGWLDTKAKIKNAKRLHGIEGPLDPKKIGIQGTDRTQSLAVQLDPDAPSRQMQALEKPDEYYERALWMVCYEMIRRGVRWEEISEWCKERNEAWRGISIGAAYESHPHGGPNVAGPTVGYLFRRMCFYAAKGARHQYEGAVYGLLSGALKEVQKVCRSWDDHLYAYYNALLLSRFDKYLLDNHDKKIPPTLSQRFAFHDAVADLDDWESSSGQVIDLLRRNRATATLSLVPMKLIQGSLISKRIEELILRVGVAVFTMLRGDKRLSNLMIDPESDPKSPKLVVPDAQRTLIAEKWHQALGADPYALRVLVHIIIALRKGLGLFDVEKPTTWAALDNVIVAYIELLRITKRIQLIPLYAAQLEDRRSVQCIASVLPDIKNSDEQKRMIGLMRQYGIKPDLAVSQNYDDTAVHDFLNDSSNYIRRFEMLEPTREDQYLWPGRRIKSEFSGFKIEQKEEKLIDTLRWHMHLEDEIDLTFQNLASALITFLVHGRIGAAETVITEMSAEALTQAKTQALCGYAFDFTLPGAEIQDASQVNFSARESLAASGRSSLRPSAIPSAADHARHVSNLRIATQDYFDLSNLVRILLLFREWRIVEDSLIQQRNQGAAKINLKKVKDLFETIQATLETLFDNFANGYGTDTRGSQDVWHIKSVYLPEIFLSYLSVVQAAAYFTNRELATKAMDLATVIADEERPWLQKVFLETGRMTELVGALAMVSQGMLKLGEHDVKARGPAKKRGSRGETLKIWDLNNVRS